MKAILILVIWIVIAAIMGVAFGVIDPLIANAIPAGDYHQLAVVAVYLGTGILMVPAPVILGVIGSLAIVAL